MNRNLVYCRSRKARDIEDSNTHFFKKDELCCETYENAIVLPARKNNNSLKWGCGGVQDAEGRYILLSSQPQRIDNGYPCSNATYSDKIVVYCGYLSTHWGHFLLDSTARLWYCLENSTVDEFVFISDENSGQTKIIGNVREFFRLLGILEKIRIITTPTRYKQVIIPEMSYFYRQFWSEKYLHPFDYIAEKAMKETKENTDDLPENVFFSRSHFKKAKVTEPGLEMLDNYFMNNNYSVYWPEEMTLSDMIRIIRNAKICAFESGTTPHNMLFAREGQTAIIIERQSVVNNYQCDVDVVRNLGVTYIDGHLTVYPVFAGGGPFFLAFNTYMRKFTDDCGYKFPDSVFLTDSYRRRCLRKYMNAYRRDYGELLGFENWHLRYIESIYEGYTESLEELGLYLSGEKLYSIMQLTRWQTIKTQMSKLKKTTMKRIGGIK